MKKICGHGKREGEKKCVGECASFLSLPFSLRSFINLPHLCQNKQGGYEGGRKAPWVGEDKENGAKNSGDWEGIGDGCTVVNILMFCFLLLLQILYVISSAHTTILCGRKKLISNNIGTCH